MTEPPLSVDGASPRLARLKRGYLTFALHLANLVLFMVVANLALAVLLRARSGLASAPTTNPSNFPKDLLARAYGNMPMAVVTGTLDETWNVMTLEARPWVHYGEAPISGKYVNVSGDGVRSNGGPKAAAGQPAFRVFVFGGSTTFGYGVPDAETIPAHLERTLRARHPGVAIEVRNYGRGYYGSSQEQALFLSLIRRGERPDAIVFLDGLNEHVAAHAEDGRVVIDEPWGMPRIREMWRRETHPAPRALPEWIPMMRLATWISGRSKQRGAPQAGAVPVTAADAARVLQGYLVNQKAVRLLAADEKIAAYFFWQPVPHYAYDLARHLFAEHYDRRTGEVIAGYYTQAERMDIGAVNLSRMLEDQREPAFVDMYHYTPTVNARIAVRLAEKVVVPEQPR